MYRRCFAHPVAVSSLHVRLVSLPRWMLGSRFFAFFVLVSNGIASSSHVSPGIPRVRPPFHPADATVGAVGHRMSAATLRVSRRPFGSVPFLRVSGALLPLSCRFGALSSAFEHRALRQSREQVHLHRTVDGAIRPMASMPSLSNGRRKGGHRRGWEGSFFSGGGHVLAVGEGRKAPRMLGWTWTDTHVWDG